MEKGIVIRIAVAQTIKLVFKRHGRAERNIRNRHIVDIALGLDLAVGAVVQKDGLAKGRNTRLGIHAGDGVDIVIAQSQRTGIVVFGCRKQVLAE